MKGKMKKAVRSFGVWLSEMPNAYKAWLAIGAIAASSFSAGVGATTSIGTFSALPDSLAAVREAQITQIIPRLEAVEGELDVRADPIIRVEEHESRLERIERKTIRNECLLEEIANNMAQGGIPNLARCVLLGNGGD